MGKLAASQSGFSIVAVIVVIVVVGVVGGAGWFAYKHDHNKPKTTTSNNQTMSKQNSKTTNSSSTSTSQNSTTFAIPEIYAKITLPSGLTSSDLKYVISTTTGVPVANFTTSSLEQADGTSSCSASQAAIGSIWRTTQAPPSSSPVTKKIGQYYYYLEEPQQPCSANQNAEQLEIAQIAELKQAFETITATN